MRDDIKKALAKFESKHYSAVQADTMLGQCDYDDMKWVSLERKTKKFWADFNAAKQELTALLEGV